MKSPTILTTARSIHSEMMNGHVSPITFDDESQANNFQINELEVSIECDAKDTNEITENIIKSITLSCEYYNSINNAILKMPNVPLNKTKQESKSKKRRRYWLFGPRLK